jgi:hypothetical protein
MGDDAEAAVVETESPSSRERDFFLGGEDVDLGEDENVVYYVPHTRVHIEWQYERPYFFIFCFYLFPPLLFFLVAPQTTVETGEM